MTSPHSGIVMITVDTSRFDQAMRKAREAMCELAFAIGTRVAEGLAPFARELAFRLWLDRTGQRACAADHETLIGRCSSCRAER